MSIVGAILLLASAGSGTAPPPPNCRIEGIDYDFDETQQPSGNYYTVTITISSGPDDEQRSISGFATIYYKYEDPYGNVRKSLASVNIYDSAPEGETDTVIYGNIFSVFPVTEVYDIKMGALNCSID